MNPNCPLCSKALKKRIEFSTTGFDNIAIRIFCKVHKCNHDALVKMNKCNHHYHLPCFLNYTRKVWAIHRACGNPDDEVIFCPEKDCLSTYREVYELEIIPYESFLHRRQQLLRKCRDEMAINSGNEPHEGSETNSEPEPTDVIAEALRMAQLSDLLLTKPSKEIMDDIYKPRTAFDWPALININLPSSLSSVAEEEPESESEMSLGSDGEESESGYLSDISVPDAKLSSDDEEEPVKDFGDGTPMVQMILSFLGEKEPDGKNYEPIVIARRSSHNTLTLELKKQLLDEESFEEDDENSEKE